MTTHFDQQSAAQIFNLDQLRIGRERSGGEYLQFWKVPSMRMGVYALAAGAEDKQVPHEEDEVYYVLCGRAVLQVDSKDYPVEAGSLVFVAAHAPAPGVSHPQAPTRVLP